MRSLGASSLAFLLSLALAQPDVALAGPDQSSEPAKQGDRDRREAPRAKNDEKQAQVSGKVAPVYRLPAVGKPRRRIGGGRRGPAEALPQVTALVPDHVARTVSSSPVLYWYVSADLTDTIAVELTLIDERSIDPVVELRLDGPFEQGVHGVRLADYAVELLPGTEYQWAVALVVDPEHRSRDIVATGWVERVPETPELAAELRSADGLDPAVYAREGLWYDALASACEGVERDPENARHQSQVAELLEQAGLPSISLVAAR